MTTELNFPLRNGSLPLGDTDNVATLLGVFNFKVEEIVMMLSRHEQRFGTLVELGGVTMDVRAWYDHDHDVLVVSFRHA